ncbi:MAG: hypothetical protein CM15mP59_4140 [Flavobacteriaceae bacterium]|nr:MAG: hypothetical protein CM15mP59_4140 [Flavobacteriaceae bacterium]
MLLKALPHVDRYPNLIVGILEIGTQINIIVIVAREGLDSESQYRYETAHEFFCLFSCYTNTLEQLDWY